MSASNKSVWIVVAVSAVVGIGVATYVARLIGEHSDRRLITAQVSEWAGVWDGARACLIGGEPTLASAGQSFLMYEAMHPDQNDRLRACEQHMRKMVRPGDESTGSDIIEKSWDNLRDATKKLVGAYALMIDPSTLRPLGTRRARMAAAIDGVDEAFARLRQDSKLEPAPMPAGQGVIAELGEGTVVQAQGSPVPVHQADLVGDTLLVQGTAEDALALAVVRGPGLVETYRIGDQALRAADASSWGTWFTTAARGNLEMRAGPLDPGGTPQDQGVVTVTARPGEDIEVRFALGQDHTRAILYQPIEGGDLEPMYKGLHLVRSSDGGATWSKPVLLAENLSIIRADDDFGRRRFDLVWLDRTQNAARWLSLGADRLDALPQPRRLFEVAPGGSTDVGKCLGEQAAWWLRGGAELYHVASEGTAARPVEDVPAMSVLTRCSDEQAVLSALDDDDTLTIHTCDPRACKQAMSVAVPDPSYQIGLGKQHGLVVVVQAAPLLLVWRPGAEPVPFLSRDGHFLHSVVEWDGTLYFIMQHEVAIRLVPANLPPSQPVNRPVNQAADQPANRPADR
jgi:hypothetical protein